MVTSCSLLITAQLALVNYYSVNFPNADDFQTILAPLNQIHATPNWSVFFSAIFEPHTQHYQVLLRVVAYMSLLVQGTLNFKILIFVGSLWLLPWLLREKRAAERLMLLSCLLSQPLYSEPMLWATNAVPYLWVNTFALLAFSCNAAWAGIFSMLAVLSWGNGIFVPAILVAAHFFKPAKYVWQLPALSAGALMHFQNSATSSAATPETMAVIKYTFQLLGSAFAYYQGELALLIGALMFLSALAIIAKQLHRVGQLDLDALLIIFLLLSLLSCAWFRVDTPESSFTTSRYTLQSALLAFLLLARGLSNARFRLPLLLAGISFCLYSNVNYFAFYELRQQVVKEAALRWQLFRKDSFCAGCSAYDAIISESERLGVFLPPDQLFTPAKEQLDLPVASPSQLQTESEYLLENEQYILASGYAFRGNTPNWSTDYYLVLKDGERRAAFQCQRRSRIDVALHLARKGDLRESGYSCIVENPWPRQRIESFLVARDSQGLWYSALGEPS